MTDPATVTELRTVTLGAGALQYLDTGGAGRPIVLLHGALMNHTLWSGVVEVLRHDFRCLVPVLPLGAHRIPADPAADLSPRGLADLIAEFLANVGLSSPTVVGNDTGGALAQLLAAHHPERVGRLVLVSCDAFENFPPGLPGRVMALTCRIPGALTMAMASLRIPALRRLPFTFGRMSKRPIDDELFNGWLDAFASDRGVCADVRRMMAGVDSADLLEAAERLRAFREPTLIVWGADDTVMPVEHAWRLADHLPDARVELVADAATLVPLDRPDRLATLIDRHASAVARHDPGGRER